MSRSLMFMTGLLCIALSLGQVARGEDQTIALTVTCKGKHTTSVNPEDGYPFDLSGEATVSPGILSDGGQQALKAIFGKLVNTNNRNAAVTTVSGELTMKESRVSGNVKIEWTIQGNPMWISGDIEGTVEMDDATVHSFKFRCANVKVGGSWNWGGGVMALGGSGEVSVQKKEEKPPEKQPDDPPDRER